MRSFKAHPTLDDLEEFAAEQRELTRRLRAACRKSYDAEVAGRNLSARVADNVARRFRRSGEVGDGRDLTSGMKLPARARELYEQAAEAEGEVAEIQRQIETSREGRQMEAYDYDLYLSEGRELPPSRRALYEANARRAVAREHAAELLDACDGTLAFFDALSASEPEEVGRLRATVNDIDKAARA